MPEQSPQNSPGQIPAQKMHPVKKFFRRLMLYLLVLMVVGGGSAYYYFYIFTYSEGNRAGILMKFSKKGNVFKTYEGELNLGGVNPMPGNTIVNNIWNFSVKDDSVGKMLEEKEGQMLRLHYKEKKKTLPWNGETTYLVDGVTELK